MSIKRTFNYLGEKVTIELSMPTNEEHNAYTKSRLDIETDKDLIAFRSAEFDKRCISSSLPKEDIFDAAKSSVMFQIFENFGIDAKN